MTAFSLYVGIVQYTHRERERERKKETDRQTAHCYLATVSTKHRVKIISQFRH